MNKLRLFVFFTMVVALASAGNLMAADTTFLQSDDTTSQVALFATLVANAEGTDVGDVRTAISVSNILAAPAGILDEDDFFDTEGTIELHLFRADGEEFVFSTADLADPEAFGNGVLDEDGALAPGETLTFFLHEALEAADVDEDTFTGYAWVICNFDAAAGTYTTFIPEFGFAQAYKMDPTLGAAFLFGGLPVFHEDE